VAAIFSEQIAFAQSVNDLKGWLHDEWDVDSYIENFSAWLREHLIFRVRAAVNLAFLDAFRDSIGQPLTSTKLMRAERDSNVTGRRPNVTRESDQGKRGKDRKPREKHTTPPPAHILNKIKVIDALIVAHALPESEKQKIFDSKQELARRAGISPSALFRSQRDGKWNVKDMQALSLNELKSLRLSVKK
jgi:hypothetical protein